MKAWLIFFKKELAVEGRYGMPMIQSLILSPLVSALPLFLVYRKMYADPEALKASWNGHSYQTEIWVGLVCHFCLNSGCAVLFNRLMVEWSQNTFALIWFSPRPRLMTLMTLSLTDVLRVLLFSVAFSLLFLFGNLSAVSFAFVLLHFFGFFLFGAFMGVARFFQRHLFPSALDLIFYIYLGLIFTSGLYFPVTLLPHPLPDLIQFNPLYQGKLAILGVIGSHYRAFPGFFFWSSLIGVWLMAVWVAHLSSSRMSETSLKF